MQWNFRWANLQMVDETMILYSTAAHHSQSCMGCNGSLDWNSQLLKSSKEEILLRHTVPSIFLIHFTSKWYKPNNHSLSLSSHQEKWRKGRESVLDWSVSRKWNLYQDKLRYCNYSVYQFLQRKICICIGGQQDKAINSLLKGLLMEIACIKLRDSVVKY